MSVAAQSIAKVETRFTPLAICGVVSILLLAGLLRALGVSFLIPTLVFGAAALLWVAFRYTIPTLGMVLALMSIFPLAFLLAKFFGPPYVASLEGCDRVVLLLLAFILWKRNGVKLVAPDWFLLICFGLALIRLAYGGSLIILLADFSFMIAYAAGRVATLSAEQQKVWARCAVWIVAVLSVLGMSEVFFFGPAPRGILYSSVAAAFTPDDVLDGRFFADSFTGLRESATMVSPPFFALLCMAALVIWWVYCRNPLPAAMITAGLICTVTRSAWFGTAGSVALVAVVMGQKRRLLLYSSLAIAFFIASVPILGLGDFLISSKTGQDPSAQAHQESTTSGLEFVIGHPLGAGPGNYNRPVGAKHSENSTSSAPFIENSYLMLASEYGVLPGLCFVGFLLVTLRQLWRVRTPLGYAALGILIGFSCAMMVSPPHQDFALATWLWFPVGLAVKSSAAAPNCAGGL